MSNTVFFDTNAIYEYLEIDHNSKVNKEDFLKYIDTISKIHLPTAAILELLVKYRNNDEMLIKILTSISSSKFAIYPTKYLAIKSDFAIFKLKTESDITRNMVKIKEQINEFLRAKIADEAKFMLMFYKIISLIIVSLVIQLLIDDDAERINALGQLTAAQKIFYEVSNQLFHEFLTDAYNDNDEKNMAKSLFDFQVMQNVSFIFYYFEDYNLSEDKKKRLGKLIKKFNEVRNQPIKVIKQLESAYKGEKWYLDQFQYVLKQHNISTYYWQFIDAKIQKWCLDGNKLRKNDIIDMIILTTLDEPDSILITFDDGSYGFLKDKKHKSVEIIDLFYNQTNA